MSDKEQQTNLDGGASVSTAMLGTFDKESYILGLFDAKIECGAALSVMRSVYEGDQIRLSGAIDAIRQAMILIEDKIAMAEAPNA